MIRIDIAGVEDLNQRLLEVPQRVERSVLLKMSKIVYDTAQEALRKHDKPRSEGGTGALFQSLYNRAIPGGREIGNDPQRAPHAKHVHWPTRPHIIKPKDRKTLRWAAGGQFIFARFVKHPGYKGDPYLANAAREAVRQMPQIVENALKGL